MKIHLLASLMLATVMGCSITQDTHSKRSSIHQTLRYDSSRASHFVSAHRGGRYFSGYPENAIETFDYLTTQVPDAIIEFDVNMTQDSVLILLHDDKLDRTSTASGPVANYPYALLQNVHLKDNEGVITPYHIPTLRQALLWVKRSPHLLTVDIKRNVPIEKVLAMLDKYKMQEQAAVITYNMADAKRIYATHPAYLISISIRSLEEWEQAKSTGIPYSNMLAFTGTTQGPTALYDSLHQNGIMAILGTIGNLDDSAAAKGEEVYCSFLKKGADILATDHPVAAAKAIATCE